MTKRLVIVFTTVFCFLAVCSYTRVSAKDTWTRIHTKNFLLIGNANEKEIRQVAARLEQFREVFSRLFTTLNVNSPVPTTVIVFKNDDSYRPFKPNKQTAGYFQSGPDVNYITLKLEGQQDPFDIIFHEYTHLLIKNTKGDVPAWFSEGLAEYYSTFKITDDQKVVMGSPIESHIHLLRDNRMLPLRTLFQVDQKSPYYNERDKQSIFYAESWALVHYLILGKDGQRMTQMQKFLELLSASVPVEQAFQQAFATSFESMEMELRGYIGRRRYPTLTGTFKSKLGYDTSMQSTTLTEAEVQAYLGDLLLHSNRPESEAYLQRALAIDPDLAMANASMGLLRVREGKIKEARQMMERAVAANSQNYLVHYYYAYALSHEQNPDLESVRGFAPEIAARIRAQLKLAIQFRPDFTESHSLLAFVNLVTDSELDETLDLLKRTLVSFPGHNDLVYMLAQIYLRKEDFATARQLIHKLSGDSDPEMRQRAERLSAQLVAVEEQAARTRESSSERSSDAYSDRSKGSDDADHNYDSATSLRKSLRSPATGETQTQGTLTRIDCDVKGSITFVVKVNDRVLKLASDGFRNVSLRSFSEDAGREVTCGPRKLEHNVVVTYLPATDVGARIHGIAKSFEFVPKDFKLNP
jgi:predicted Zn-dependent protease